MNQLLANIEHLTGLSMADIVTMLKSPTLLADTKLETSGPNCISVADPLGAVTDNQFSQWLSSFMPNGSGLKILVCGEEAYSALTARAKERRGYTELHISYEWNVMLSPQGQLCAVKWLAEPDAIVALDIPSQKQGGDIAKRSNGVIEHVRSFIAPQLQKA